MRNQRKLKNIVIEPAKQYKYVLMNFCIMTIGAFSVMFLLLQTVQRVLRQAMIVAGADPELLSAAVAGQSQEFVLRAALIFPVLGLGCMAIALRMSHRFLGPQISINRHIDALIDGDYASNCHIRRDDELHTVAGKLNDLAAALRERHRVEGQRDAA